jgi:hypothetical protein
MSSDGGWDSFFRLLTGIPRTQAAPAAPEQPALLSTTVQFFAAVGKKVRELDMTLGRKLVELEEFGDKAGRVFVEVAEGWLELVEYHGGNDEALIYVEALAYLEQKPDAELEDRLRRLMRQYHGDLELRRLWNLLDRHRSRIHRTAVAERALAVRGKIRLYDSLKEACDVLASGYGVTREQLLISEIQETLCSEGTFLLHDEDVVRETTNRIRQITRAKKEPQTVADVLEHLGIEDPDFELLRILVFLQQTEETARTQKSPPSQQELQSLAACAYMSQDETGAELERSKDQVKIERRRALDKLRKAAEL